MRGSWVLGVVVAALTLVACSNSAAPAPPLDASPAPIAAPVTPGPSSLSAEDEALLGLLGEPRESPQAAGLVAAANAVCDRLDPVTTTDDFIAAQISIRSDFPAAVNRPGTGIVGFEDAATFAYCPAVGERVGELLLREAGLTPPPPQPGPVIPEGECVGYGCSEQQDAELNRGEREANSGGG